MKFLCLCGAYGSSEKFKVQLAPLVNELSSDNTAELHFIHGPVQAFPPEGFEEYFGTAPYFRFIEGAKAEDGSDDSDVLERIRNFPEGGTAEDQMRELMYMGVSATPLPSAEDNNKPEASSAQKAIDYLYRIMKDEGPFEGIIGYSEGATMAATLLLHEQWRYQTMGIPTMFKCALFFAGWPPMNPDLDAIVLADESDLTITIPTCHVSEFKLARDAIFELCVLTIRLVGSLDPYLAGSLALYNVCDMDTAYLFDHAKGHTLPRHKDTVKELGDVLRIMISDIETDSHSSSDGSVSM
ncbi:Esterase FUS5 [Lachnellula cervina]|uniref:Esterase FUS5 n=1 Tax=Lachnellula cervina TaxID=1316786 RepID=A0A7D8UVK6_9HELO|nr:Esterase FUS5 [Lachnellula cervina]